MAKVKTLAQTIEPHVILVKVIIDEKRIKVKNFYK